MNSRNEREAIRKIVLEEMRWRMHYDAQVTSTDDPKKAGRVRATVPMLGWNQDSQTTWFWPRDKHSMVVPAVGEWIEVYFVHGDPNMPAYLGNAAELQSSPPAAFDGQQTTVVLWQDPKTGDAIVYDATVPEIRILGKGDNLVTYTALNTALQNLVTAINAKFATKQDAAGAAGGLSIDISGSKAKHLRTDG